MLEHLRVSILIPLDHREPTDEGDGHGKLEVDMKVRRDEERDVEKGDA